eukprot:m.195532 g.195532  ORF g.195532 m.195532 type:complete len:967 (-) comp32573_c1_seq3:107-3007(-)
MHWIRRHTARSSIRRPSGHRRSFSAGDGTEGGDSLLGEGSPNADRTSWLRRTSPSDRNGSPPLHGLEPGHWNPASNGTEDLTSSDLVPLIFECIIGDNAARLMAIINSSVEPSNQSAINSTRLDVNSTFGRAERPLLHVASSLGAHDCLCVLVRNGADVDKKDSQGTTATHLAARNGHKKCIESLVLHYHADVSVADDDGYTAVHWLARNGRLSSLEFMLNLGPSVDFEDHNGQTALHVTCQGGHTPCASYLIQRGANINKVDNLGRNCLFYASKCGSHECCELLLRHGVQLVSDRDNHDAFDAALSEKHSLVASRLIVNFPQLLARIVNEASKPNHDEELIIETLMKFSRTSAATMKSTVEALANLASTTGLQLLCTSSNETTTGSAFIRLIRVFQQLLRSEGKTKIEKTLQLTAAQDFARHALEPVWSALEDWLDLIHTELETARSSSACYSNSCKSGAWSACYSSSCLARKRAAQDKTDQQFDYISGSMQDSFASKVAGRIVKMVHAFYQIHHTQSEYLDAEIHTFFTRHRRVMRWLILRDMSIIFNQLNFILGHAGLLHLIQDVIRVQPFEMRRAWFYQHIGEAQAPSSTWTPPVLTVTRNNVFEMSCELLAGQEPKMTTKEHRRHSSHLTPTYEHKRPFAIQFEDEPGIGEGVKREWFEILTREILDANYALFLPSEDLTTYQPNPNSSVNADHLSYFEFAGKIIGLAIFHRQPLAVHFTRSFYKHMLSKPASYLDAASLDPQYMQSINWILENDIEDADLDLNFSTETQNFGITERVDLLPGGANIPVTDENKHGYVQLLVAQRLSGSIQGQIKSFNQGLWSFIPRPLLSLFDEYELELLISGIPEIDVHDWKTHCRYSGYTEDSPTVKIFWDVMASFDQAERALVLQFSTGSSRLPIGGFAHMDASRRFTLSREQERSRLPTASTCFNLLKLPSYQTSEVLREKLLMAIRDASEGFSFN